MTATDAIEATDPADRARELLDKARARLAAGRLHGASSRAWRAAEHMAEAVAAAQGWRYERHADFSVVLNSAFDAIGDERVLDGRSRANELHGNYYSRKRDLNPRTIANDIQRVAELLDILEPLTQPR